MNVLICDDADLQWKVAVLYSFSDTTVSLCLTTTSTTTLVPQTQPRALARAHTRRNIAPKHSVFAKHQSTDSPDEHPYEVLPKFIHQTRVRQPSKVRPRPFSFWPCKSCDGDMGFLIKSSMSDWRVYGLGSFTEGQFHEVPCSSFLSRLYRYCNHSGCFIIMQEAIDDVSFPEYMFKTDQVTLSRRRLAYQPCWISTMKISCRSTSQVTASHVHVQSSQAQPKMYNVQGL